MFLIEVNWWQKYRNLSPPVRWLMLFIVVLLGLSFLFAPTPQPVNFKKANFAFSSDSRLYFQNMRSFYYHLDERSKKPMRIFRLKRRKPANDSLSLQFSIVIDPIANRAYPYAELGMAYKQYDSLYVGFNKYGDRNRLSELDSEGHYALAAKVFSSLIEERSVYLLNGKDTLKELYTSEQNRINVETTLEDYFKLIRKI